MSRLIEMLFNEELSDGQIITREDLVIPIHRSIICCQSPVIKAMFSSKWNSDLKPQAYIRYEVQSVARLLYCLYVGVPQDITGEWNIPLKKFNFPSAKSRGSESPNLSKQTDVAVVVKENTNTEAKLEGSVEGSAGSPAKEASEPSLTLTSPGTRLLELVKLYELADFLEIPSLKRFLHNGIINRIEKLWQDPEKFSTGLAYAYDKLACNDPLITKALEIQIVNEVPIKVTHSCVLSVIKQGNSERWSIIQAMMSRIDMFTNTSRVDVRLPMKVV